MADIRHSLQISAPPTVIYPLVSTAPGFAQWWSQDVSEDVSEAEGLVQLGFFKRNTIYRLRRTGSQPPNRIDRPERIEWMCESGKEWAGTLLVFHLEAVPTGTLLGFTHAGWESDTPYFISCNTVWGELLFRLKAAAEGHPRGPLFLADSLAY